MRYSRPQDFEHLGLKKYDERVEIDTSEACRLAVLSMARQAVRSLEIVSRRLDPAVYDDADFVDAVAQLCLGSPRVRVRVLVREPAPIVKRGHRLLALAQRLSTFIDIRVPSREHADYNSAFFLADGAGVVYRTLADRYEAKVSFNDPRGAQELGKLFEEMWQTASPDPNLRRTYL